MRNILVVIAVLIGACGGQEFDGHNCTHPAPLNFQPCTDNGVLGYLTPEGTCYVDPVPECRVKVLP